MRILSAALIVLLLAACQDPAPLPPKEPLEFTGPGYTLNVASISVVQDYKSPKTLPNVEHLSDITPAQAVKRWAGVRLTAAGHENTLEVDIKDASIVKTELPKQKTGIEGMLTNEQTEKYDGTVSVAIKIYNPQRILPIAHLDVTVQRSLTLPENAAPIDRERAYHRLTIDLVRALEPELDTNIHRYLGGYLL